MIGRFIRNFLNGQHIIHKIRQVQAVRPTFLHQCIKNERPSAAVLSLGARMASSSNRTSQRSKLLNDYLNNRAANLQLADLGNHVLEFALDPRGSSFIKQKLESANPAETAQLMDELRGHVVTLALHKSGSHVIEKALELITNELSAQVLLLSLHEYGNLVIRCVLEHCTEQQKRSVLELLHGNVLSLVTDKHGVFVIEHLLEHGLPEDREPIYGCFVIQHVIEHGLPEDRERIVRGLQENINSLSFHEYGNWVIRSLLEHCTEQQKRPVLEQLHGNVLNLVTDKYGNYVIRHVIEHGRLEDREGIVRCLQGDIMKSAHHLNISFIIEKCVVFGNAEQRNALIDQVCADNGSGIAPLLEMMKYPMGNKVVLKMLNVADPERREKMMLIIKTAPIKSTNRSSKSFTHTVQAQQRGGAE
uniref:PUM-HD domain-containing protein n=1 Tax=Globodera rostochiensis TaxID=31243 RepID=A0A914I383_GLORO